MKEKDLEDIRQAIADYMYSEAPFSCCANTLVHEEDETRLAELLNVPRFYDGSGWDFGLFRSDAG